MQLQYDEDFIEGAVLLGASGRHTGVPGLQIARFHRDREKLYSILDPRDRNDAFFRLNLTWFREWGFDRFLAGMLAEFPLVRGQLGVLAVRKTSSQRDEGAELFVNGAGQRTGLLALRIERLANGPKLMDYLRHEFTHLHDMLNPDFGYSPELVVAGANPAQLRLARERYRLLWDITIDGRLAAAGRTPLAPRDQHTLAFARGFPFWTANCREEIFARLWNAAAPRHVDILGMIADPRGLREARRPAPGALCPLCGFTTFHWACAEALPNSSLARIVSEFPAWEPEQGLCARCSEIYAVAVASAY